VRNRVAGLGALVVAVGVPGLIAATATAGAQATLPPATGTPGVAGEMRSVDGRLLLGGSGDPRPLSGHYVVLHRISADSAGPIDSMRTPADGRYRFRYRLASTNAMYIVSSRYAGVAYFTVPLRAANVTGPDGDLVVYDTTSRAFPLTVRGRHFVVSPSDGTGMRRVVDVFELANDSTRTIVVGPGSDATWRVRIPDGVQDPRSSGGDLPPDAFRFIGNEASIDVPFQPGVRQVVLTYGVPRGGTVSVPIETPTQSLEVLVEGGGVSVAGASLAAEPSVTMEGRTFQRYVAGAVPAGTAFTLRFNGGGGLGGSGGRFALLVLAAAALGAGIYYGRRNASGAVAAAPEVVVRDAEAIARAIAALDEAFEAPSRQDDASQAVYRDRRAAMKAQLVRALSVEREDDTQ